MKRLIVLTLLLLASPSFAGEPITKYADGATTIPIDEYCAMFPESDPIFIVPNPLSRFQPPLPQSNVYNMTIKQGSDLRIDFIWIDSDGDSISIDDNIVRMAIRKRVSSKDTLLYADTIGGEFVISSTETGYIRLTISGARTALLNFSTAYYDIEVVNTQGVIYDFCRGRIILIKEVTR